MSQNYTSALPIALAALLAVGCEQQAPVAAPAPAVDDISLADVSLERPEQDVSGARGIYMPIAVPQEQKVGVKSAMVVGGPPLPVFMNRFGGTYTGGFDNSAENRSSVVGQGTATIGGYGGSEAQWQEVMACVTEQFARFNVFVTDIEPTTGDYVESVVGGHPSQVGLPNGVGGVAPIDNFQCNIISRAVVYTFTDNIGNNPQNVCEVVAQEVAHAFSLDHEFLCEDPMSYLNGCGEKSFRDIDAQCGEFSARACNCNRPTHNSVQLLFEKLGPSDGTEPPPPPQDDGPPVVGITFPADGDTLPQNSQIQVIATATDDTRIVSAELVWDFNGQSFGCPTQQQGISCAVNGDTYTWSINVGTGERSFRVSARDAVGNVVETATRTVQLGDVAGDTEAPTVGIVSPVDNGERQENSQIQVVATASDNVGVSTIELLWEFSGNAFGCPLNDQAVQCEIAGDTYTWTLNVGTGSRGFQVRALDGAGNEAVTDRRVIELVADPQPDPEPTDPDPTDPDPTDPTDPVDPVDPTDPTDPGAVQDDIFEDNDTFAVAAKLACAAVIDATIQVGDDDWYSVAVDENVAVTLTATSPDGAPMHIAVADQDDGTFLLESNDDRADKSLDVTSASDEIAVRIQSPQAGNYRLVITCDDALGGVRDTQPIPEQNCSSAGGSMAPAFLALGLVALLRRRRR